MNFLTRSRHGTRFYYRRRVPKDLRPLLGQDFLVRSLGTSERRTALILARDLAVRSDDLFKELRTMAPFDPLRIQAFTLKAKFTEENQLGEIELQAEPHEASSAAECLRAMIDAHLAGSTIQPGRLRISTTVTGMTVRETWEAFKKSKIAGKNWKDGEDTAKNDHWPHIEAFIELVGDKPIRAVSADDVIRFQSAVMESKGGGAARNRMKRLTRVGALFRWAKTKRYVDDSFTELFRYEGKVENNGYVMFDRNDLKALFESNAYKNGSYKAPSDYWLPILGLFTGARLNELCQLTKKDIGEHDGVATIAILDEDYKRLKTASSKRVVPIHSKLIELGFLDYVGTIRADRIFPELPDNPARRGDFTKGPSRKFTAYRRQCGVGTDKLNPKTQKWTGRSRKVFHSFRSTLIDALRKADVPAVRMTRLAGHDYRDTQNRYYTGGDVVTMFNFGTLKSDIEKVEYPVAFEPYQGRAMRLRKAGKTESA